MYKLLLAISVILLFSCAQKKSEKKEQPVPVESSKGIDYQLYYQSALNGQLGAIENLINQGANVNETDSEGRTALMLASYNGHSNTVKYLLSKGANVNASDKIGRTSLMFASTGPFIETVELLVKANANVNMVDSNESFTALMFAAAEGQLEVVKFLMENGADANLKDTDGELAIDFARTNKHAAVVNYLNEQ